MMQNIWEGAPDLVLILLQFKTALQQHVASTPPSFLLHITSSVSSLSLFLSLSLLGFKGLLKGLSHSISPNIPTLLQLTSCV